jgi:hypothetical protein
MQEEGAVETLRSRLLEEKVLDWLFDQAKLVEPPPMPDLSEAVEASSEDEPEAAEEPEAPVAEKASVEKTWKAAMKKDELLEIAKEHGLAVNTKSTKAQILEALDALL